MRFWTTRELFYFVEVSGFMKKSAAAIVSSLLVLGCVYPVCAAPKNVYTDADSGFSVQTVDPMIEYASKHSYGFQENKSITDSLTSVAAIPADVLVKKTGITFTTKEFKEKLAAEMNKKSGARPDYALFRPETYTHAEDRPYLNMEDSMLDCFDKDELQHATFSYETKTVGKHNFFVISMQYPGAFDKEKGIDQKATDKKLYITSENNILYLTESYCSAETEAAKKAKADENKNSTLKKDYEEKGISPETAGSAVQDPKALQKALLPLTDSSLNDPQLQKALQKEREAVLKGLTFFKPDKSKKAFGMNEPVLKQFISLPDNWLYVRATPELKVQDGVSANVAWAAPHTMISNLANLAKVKDFDKDLKPEDLYKIYDESVLFASYRLRKSNKNKNFSDLAEEIFKIPQSDMQKALNEMLPKLLDNEDLKKYALLSNTKAKIANDGQVIKLSFDTNVKVMNRFDFLTCANLAGTRNNGLFSLYISKGDKAMTKAVSNLADKVKLLPEK